VAQAAFAGSNSTNGFLSRPRSRHFVLHTFSAWQAGFTVALCLDSLGKIA
jgi:hypothetical protein